MFLKSLEIFGFKSFADRTRIEFADGITALVGPNGCGKSNVVDAVKWVLAEGRSRNLRADKMEDVIFNGTETRPALNVADVTLTIDNESGLLPVESSEIQIRRRLFRSGESEYSVNGQQCGPGAIRRLVMDTGIGKAAYSVMEQGKVSQILSSKPEDRRYLFEEAAGISRSKEEAAEAERNLEKTRAVLQTIGATLAEIKRGYDSLKAQSEKTARFRSLKDEIFICELDLQLLRLKNSIQDKTRGEAEKAGLEEKRAAVRSEIAGLKDIMSENLDKVRELQEKVHGLNSELVKVGAEQNGRREMAKQLGRRRSEIRERIAQIESRRSSVQERMEALNEEIDSAEADLHDKGRQLEAVHGNIVGFEENVRAASGQIDSNRRRSQENATRVAGLDEALSGLQKELASITEDIVTELDARLRDAGYSSAACRAAKEEVDALLGRIRVLARGRGDIFRDFAAKDGQSAAEAQEFARSAVVAFEETERLALSLEKAVAGYARATPAFIDEFLSPDGIITRKRGIDGQIAANRAQAAHIEEENASLKEESAELAVKIDSYKETLGRLRVNQAQMQAQLDSGRQQISLLKRSLTTEAAGLRELEDEMFSEGKAAEDIDEQLEDIQSELSEIELRGRRLAAELNDLDAEIARGNKDVLGKESLLREKEAEEDALQSRYEKLAMRLASSDTEIKAIRQNFIDAHSRDLTEFEERMYRITEQPAALRERLGRAKEELRALGQVNLMAPDEFVEVKERFERQSASYADTQKSLVDFERISEEIRSKATEQFLDTYNKIKKNFHNMFRRLFNGGRAELRLVDPQSVLTTGIDIYAQPPGKKLENIALLSGGEKTMTAVALLFATYQVRPSPFCLLDEIDAALDDNNVSSFVNTLRSFAGVSQYIVITHNKKTAAGTSTMLGVTMEESGVSKVISVRMEDVRDGAPPAGGEEFIEEDVPEESGAYVPPRPAPRIHNEDGTVTDPDSERLAAAVREKVRVTAQNAAEKETRTANSAENKDNGSKE